MKKVFAFACCVALFAACSGGEKGTSDSKSEPAAAAKPAKKKPDGEKIYKTYCVTCHGIYGDMGGSGAFDLTTSTLSLDERIQVITNGRNLMTPFEGILSQSQMEDAATYSMTLPQ